MSVKTTETKGKMKMAKIIDLPTLRKLTKQDQKKILNQVFEARDKLTNMLDFASDKEMTTDLRQRLQDEIITVLSMMTNADEVIRSAYTRKKR